MENKNSSCCNKLSLFVSLAAIAISASTYFCKSNKVEEKQTDSTLDERVKSIVLDFIKQDPQCITDAIGEGFAKKRDKELDDLSKNVASKYTEIRKQAIMFGKPDSKNIFVCFFDPLCKHCIDFQKTMIKLIKAKKDATFKLLPVGVLGEDSIKLAKYYLAVYAKNPEKALAFIEKIVTSEKADQKAIDSALKDINITADDIKDLLTEGDKQLVSNGMLAEKLKIPVVPATFFMKDGQEAKMVQATGVDQILPLIEELQPSDTEKNKPEQKQN